MTRMPNIAVCSKEDLMIDVAKKLIEKQIDSSTCGEANRKRLRGNR